MRGFEAGVRYGPWLAGLGTALQLVGLCWDALMHQLDAELAMRESVFSLENPSHLLLVVGLTLTVLGLVWYLSVPGARRGGLLFSGVLASLLMAMAGLGWSSGGLLGRHDHPAATSIADSLANNPTFPLLQEVMRKDGMEAALDRLEALAATDEGVLRNAHDLAHGIGKYALAYYGSPSEVFGRCRETFQSGCHHGVLEAYLAANPKLGQQEVVELCERTLTASAVHVVRFQCLHGLGHGLTSNLNHDIFQALRLCDLLRTEWDRGSCYSGVFMENIIFASHAREQGDAHAHEHGRDHRVWLNPDDPLYPCNILDDRYKPECFVMQTSAILMFNGQDFGRAILECDRAPEKYIPLCYQSIGRDVSSFTYRDPARSLELCQQGSPAYLGFCLLGAAKNMIDVTWKIDQALELCAAAPSAAKPLCYTAVGEQVATISNDAATRAQECARVESEYRWACRTGANLSGSNHS